MKACRVVIPYNLGKDQPHESSLFSDIRYSHTREHELQQQSSQELSRLNDSHEVGSGQRNLRGEGELCLRGGHGGVYGYRSKLSSQNSPPETEPPVAMI